MHPRRWTAVFLLLAPACGSEGSNPDESPSASTGDAPPDGEAMTEPGPSTGAADETSGGPDEETSNASSSSGDAEAPIGTLILRGSRSFDQSTLDPPACDTVCADLGGSCDDARAGRSYYDCGSYSQGGVFYSCGWAEEPDYYDADDQLCRLTEYSCDCDDVPLEEPRVEVLASEGPHSCDEACESWRLGCSEGGSVYDEFGEWDSGVDCTGIPSIPPEGRLVCECVG